MRQQSSGEPVVDVYTKLLTLKLLPRTGWLQRGQVNAESIAEHTFGVATLALLVGDRIPGLDRGKLLAMALLHDMAEVLVGDLPSSARSYVGAAVKHEAEWQAMQDLLGPLPAEQRAAYLALWQEYHQGGSREARLVKLLDKVEMLMQALAYEQAGNLAMGEFWETLESEVNEEWSQDFPEIQAMLQCLVDKRWELTHNHRTILPPHPQKHPRHHSKRVNGHWSGEGIADAR